MKRVYLVRHGQTEGNIGNFYQFYDTPLAESGLRGAEAVAIRCKELKAEVVISSDMKRAHQTAEKIAEATALELILEQSLHETMQAKEIRGKSKHEGEGLNYRETWPENFVNSEWKPEGAENYFDVKKRIEKVLKVLAERPEKNIIAVSHEAFIKLLVADILLSGKAGADTTIEISNNLLGIANVGICVITYNGERWRLEMYNDHAHFAE